MEHLKEILDKDTENREILNNDLTQNKEELEHTKEEYERIEQALEEINQAIDASKNQVHELRLKMNVWKVRSTLSTSRS